MPLDQRLKLSLAVLLAGLVVAFAILIFILRSYGSAIRKLQKEQGGEPEGESPRYVQDDPIPEEVVAVIAAAVCTVYGLPAGNIRSIRKSVRSSRSAWKTAGLLENTRPF